MKKASWALIIIASIGFSNLTIGQTPFKKVINNASGFIDDIYYPYLFKIKIDSSGNYLLKFGNTILLLDTTAVILSAKAWWTSVIPGYDLFTDFTTTQDGNYILLGSEFASLQNNFLFKADTNGTILWKQKFSGPYYTNYPSLTNISDGGFLIAGFEGSNSPLADNVSLRKVDSTGNQIWEKCFDFKYVSGRPVITQLSKDGNYLLGLSGQVNNTPSPGTVLMKVDTSGHLLWSKFYYPMGSYLYNMIENTDGSIMLLGNRNYNAGNKEIYLMKVDSSGIFLWSKLYGNIFDYNAKYSLRSTSDGGYIISGSIHPISRSGQYIMLIKTDSLGNVHWTRSHGYTGTSEFAIDALQTKDGGYFIYGATYDSPGPGCYIIKTDSLGFAGCQEYTDTLIVNNIFITDSIIIPSDTIIPTFVVNSLMRDSIISYPNTFDGCILNSIPEINRIKFSDISLYPNPNIGTFTLSYNFPIASALFQIKDLTGRTVFNHNIISTTGSETFDVSVLCNGIYLWEVNSETEVLSKGKIVMIK